MHGVQAALPGRCERAYAALGRVGCRERVGRRVARIGEWACTSMIGRRAFVPRSRKYLLSGDAERGAVDRPGLETQRQRVVYSLRWFRPCAFVTLCGCRQ